MRTHEDSLATVVPSTSPPRRLLDRHDDPPLTDQAQVAVALAESFGGADPRGRPATVAHLVAAIAGEPEGIAGTTIRHEVGDLAARIAVHPASTAAALPRARIALVAVPVMDRPAWTSDLLTAALRVGGTDLEALLEDEGWPSGSSGRWRPRPGLDGGWRVPLDPDTAGEEVVDPETFGRFGLLHVLSDAADLAVARTRAAGGDSRTLLGWLHADETTRTALAQVPAVPVDDVIAEALRRARSRDDGDRVDVRALEAAVTHLSVRAAMDRSPSSP